VSEATAPTEHVDVVVVGARVAGATVAALLGDAGVRVLLVDRVSFPSATLSTHFFRGGHAVSVFRRLGVLDRLLALGASPLRCEYTYIDDDAAEVGPPQDPGDVGYSLSVRREALDEVLVRRAATSLAVELAERTRLDVSSGATAASSASSSRDHAVDVSSQQVSSSERTGGGRRSRSSSAPTTRSGAQVRGLSITATSANSPRRVRRSAPSSRFAATRSPTSSRATTASRASP